MVLTQETGGPGGGFGGQSGSSEPRCGEEHIRVLRLGFTEWVVRDSGARDLLGPGRKIFGKVF